MNNSKNPNAQYYKGGDVNIFVLILDRYFKPIKFSPVKTL